MDGCDRDGCALCFVFFVPLCCRYNEVTAEGARSINTSADPYVDMEADHCAQTSCRDALKTGKT